MESCFITAIGAAALAAAALIVGAKLAQRTHATTTRGGAR